MSDEHNAGRAPLRDGLDRLDGLAAEIRTSPVIATLLGGGPLAVFETHAARIIVGRTHALKLKRAVRYRYLDFSTRELRDDALRRELLLNRPHAPEIYLRLVAIGRGADGALTIDDGDMPRETGLLMCRFEQHDLLSSRLEAGRLSPALCKALGDMVARYHAEAPARTGVDAARHAARLVEDIGEGLAAADAMFSAGRPARWREAAEAAAREAAPLLAARASAGHVRRCHGDLHAGNIVLWHGSPLAFDALEFDEHLATIDTLYDLAFLLMDLDERGHPREANMVLNRYLWRTGGEADLDGLAALPMFLSLRAAVRAMVEAQARGLAFEAGKEADPAGPRAYLDAALRYLDSRTPPRLIAVAGLSGTGKSTLAASLAPLVGRAPGALHLRSDLERKALFGVEETERLPPETYTVANSDAVYARLLSRAGHALAAGHSVVLDAVSLTQREQDATRDLARRHRAAFDALWLEAPLDVLRSRIGGRSGDASDATPDVVSRQASAEPNPAGWSTLDASGSADATLATARTRLGL